MVRMIDNQLIKNFIKHCKRQNKTQKTIENYVSAINIFHSFLHEYKYNFLSVDGNDNKVILEDFLD